MSKDNGHGKKKESEGGQSPGQLERVKLRGFRRADPVEGKLHLRRPWFATDSEGNTFVLSFHDVKTLGQETLSDPTKTFSCRYNKKVDEIGTGKKASASPKIFLIRDIKIEEQGGETAEQKWWGRKARPLSELKAVAAVS